MYKRQDLNYLFKSGDDGYNCFRIPTIIKAKNDVILAFAEGRKKSCSDTGDVDLVYKKSYDNGKTWSSLKIIWDDDGNTCGNPSPVLDKKSGRISLLATWNRGEDKEWQIIDQKSIDTRHVYLIHSNDNGESWTNPKEITKNVKLDNWTWYATGPVNGIQLKKGPNKERLIIPCDHIEADTKHYYSHIIYSDDGGLNWNPVVGSTSRTMTPTILYQTTQYRRRSRSVLNGVNTVPCDNYSNIITITVAPDATGGNVERNTDPILDTWVDQDEVICIGDSPQELRVANSVTGCLLYTSPSPRD